MKEIKAYQCNICKSVYNSIEECRQCEIKCSDRCVYESELILFDEGNESSISIEYNYDYYKHLIKSDNKFLLDLNGESVALTLDDISKIIEMLSDAKDYYMTDLLLRKESE